ncbi:hypothetical protein PISMIDRAFT_687215, partial [Pisolithus microcarpus 441]
LPQGMANVIDTETAHVHLGRRVTSICQNQDLSITAASDFPMSKLPERPGPLR